MPEVLVQPGEQQQVDGSGNTMPNAERGGGALLLGRTRAWAMLFEQQPLEFRFERAALD